MIKRGTKCALLLLIIGFGGVRSATASCGYAEGLRLHWIQIRKMMTEIAAAMPEDKYDYRPVKEVRSFREMLQHVVQDTYAHMGSVEGASDEQVGAMIAKYRNAKGRSELLQALNETYDYGDKVLGTLTDDNAMDTVTDMEIKTMKMTRLEAVLMAFDDQMDHYGNFVVYLRSNRIVPPATVQAAQQFQLYQQQMQHP